MHLISSRGLDPTRRRALIRLALGTSAMGGLAGCVPNKAVAQLPAECPVVMERDLPLLESLVIMEGIAEDTYLAAAGLLTAQTRPAAELFASHHHQHRAEAIARLIEYDFEVPERRPLTHLPELPSEPSAEGDLGILSYALAVEQQAVRTYMGLLAQFTAPEFRVYASDIMACEVAHVVALRAVLPAPAGAGDVISAADFPFFSHLGASE